MNILRRSIPWNTVLVYMALFIAVISAIAGWSYRSVTEHLRRGLNDTNSALLSQITRNVDSRLREIDKYALNFVQEPSVTNFINENNMGDNGKISSFLELSDKMRSYMFSNELIHSMYLYSRPNGMLMSSTMLSDRSEFFDTGWLDEFDKADGMSKWLLPRIVTFNPNSKAEISKHLLTLVRSYPMNSGAESRRGAFAVNIDEERLSRLIDENGGRALGRISIVDADGTVVSDPSRERVGSRLEDEPFMERLNTATGEGYFNSVCGKTGCTVYYVVSPYTGWKYVSIAADQSLRQSSTVIRNTLLAAACGILLAAAAAMLTVGGAVYRPIRSFVQGISRQLSRHPVPGKPERLSSLPHLEKLFGQMIEENQEMHEHMRKSKPALRWQLLTDILMANRTDYEKEKPLFDFLGIDLYASHFIVMTAQFDRIQDAANPRDAALYTYGLCNVAEEFMRPECKGAAIQLENGRAAFLLSFGEEQEPSPLVAMSIADLIQGAVRDYFKQTVCIGVGRAYRDMSDIRQSYRESLEALNYHVITGADAVICFEDIKPQGDAEMIRALAGADKIVDAMKRGEAQAVRELLRQFFQEVVSGGIGPDSLKLLCAQLEWKAMMAATELGADLASRRSGGGNALEKLNQLEHTGQLQEHLDEVLQELTAAVRAKRSGRAKNDTIAAVLGYIGQHYGRSDLSLNLLSDQFTISVSYLSRQFKEHMGCNFMEFVIGVRMEAAKKLLSETDKKVNEVAEEVGYVNAYSFIRIFKKHAGVTPGEFREAERLRDAK